jgi:hypothetical protein
MLVTFTTELAGTVTLVLPGPSEVSLWLVSAKATR